MIRREEKGRQEKSDNGVLVNCMSDGVTGVGKNTASLYDDGFWVVRSWTLGLLLQFLGGYR
jgi:hypothetical protein